MRNYSVGFGIMMFLGLMSFTLFSIQQSPKEEQFKALSYRVIGDTVNTNFSVNEARVKFIISNASQFNYLGSPFRMKTSVNGVWKEVEVSGNSFEYQVEPGNYAFNLLIDSMYTEMIIPKLVLKPQHDMTVKVTFYPRPRSIDKQRGTILLEKPVIYVYSDEEVPLTVNVKPKGDFSFTYPESTGTWTGTATRNGFKMNGSIYPYLFWEAQMDRNAFTNWEKSTVIAKNDVLSYLEQVCQKVGLNNKEKTDLITYWAPRMMKYEKVEVLALTENIDDMYGELKVSDPTFTVSRFYLVFKETNKETSKLSLQQLEKMTRKDKFVLEWGGADFTSQTL